RSYHFFYPLARTTVIALGLLTIVIQWDESFVQNISPKTVTKFKKYPYSIMPHQNKIGKVCYKF
ncbi:hypothetical protein OAQ63_02375, partial [Planktomarina temperata]|nr:hypothetical protein [Planktomarina temperata]